MGRGFPETIPQRPRADRRQGFFVYGIGSTLDRLFYPEALPTPTFGAGGIFWGSLTLALLTVPVVIIATEEGLAAGAAGRSRRIPCSRCQQVRDHLEGGRAGRLPGILTVMILAMARA